MDSAFAPTILLLVLFFSLALAAAEPKGAPAVHNAVASITAARCPDNPLITQESSRTIGRNINGPSVIRVPDWLPNPLGKYYMYFGDHGGKFIRLAYADDPAGPWKVHESGTLRLEQATAFKGHIASPDVHVDDARKEIRMYFHGPAADRNGQWTGVAISKNGLDFTPSTKILGKFYFRVFQWQGAYYAIAKNWNEGWGELYRSPDGLEPFELRGNFLARMRHCAVTLRGDQLLVFYSRVGDEPERILLATVRLTDNWRDWQESDPIEVLQPEAPYEGIEFPLKPSRFGSAIKVRELRDPCIFEEAGKTFLYYTIAGEMGIAMARLDIRMKAE